MNKSDDGVLIAEAIRRLYAQAGLPWPPPLSLLVAPVPLDRLIASYNLVHEEVPGLTAAAAGAFLARWGLQRPELLADTAPLAGFLFANASGGYILVNAEDNLPRRRFTAAHELGHYLLHFLPRLEAERDAETYLVQSDAGDMVREEEKAADDKTLSLPEMERQANRFAAELLMPEVVCRTMRAYTVSSRFLEHHLARDLLVSREAMRWRLRSLHVTQLPARSASDGFAQ
jgi:Zn-dependent peptidase ImmA (M78 family)